MDATEKTGFSYFGATSEHAVTNSATPRASRQHSRSARGNMAEMIPVIFSRAGALVAALVAVCLTARAGDPPPAPAAAAKSDNCLASGDGYLRAHVAGAINATIDWPNAGTRCQGESKNQPPGVRLSFQRAHGGRPDLLFVFGLTGVTQGKPARATGANLTIIQQGTTHIFGTLGDSRCTVDSLTQTPLDGVLSYRIEARGFCTQPAHAVRGNGDVLVSTFEFAGPVDYLPPEP
jgi:hypothetical protein